MKSSIQIGRLLRAGVKGFVAGCTVDRIDLPRFGALVRVPLAGDLEAVGLIYDIHVDDDGLVRQLAAASEVLPSTIQDAQVNRNVPLEISVLTIGHLRSGEFFPALPPRPPLSLNEIFLCTEEEISKFTGRGQYGYFRHFLHHPDLPLEDVLVAHLAQTQPIHRESGNPDWIQGAVRELVVLLREDYQRLMGVMYSLRDLEFESIQLEVE